ncbi:hypothetical protein [Aedoeadaptatus urinae]|uniref:hypothetical protein n=1 Tax=Aedoeadaptatus urinae TaxID=1871017 RepID=UPI00097DE839|nr:hypothetical protein [Peptoniphilus urinae]
MKLDFLTSRKGDIPERNSEMKPFLKDTLSRIKQGNFSKKEQAALAAVLILAASGTGYGAFIHAPLAQQEALKAALKATPSVAHAQEGPGGAYADEKTTLKETEVEQAIANDIASDPNVEITSEEVVPDGENSGLMNLVVDHYGSTDTLSQYLETLQGVSYKLNIDSISYNRDPSDVESSSIRLSVPYEIVDNSLASKTFDTQAPEAAQPTAPDTTATPGTGSTAPSTPSTSSGSGYYSSGSSSSSWTPRYPSASTTPATPSKPATPAAKTPAPKPQAQPQAKPQVKPQSETPPRMPERVYLAPAVSTYSILDTVISASTVDGLPVTCEPQGNTNTDKPVEKKDQVLAVKFETPQRDQGAEGLKRVINLDTGGIYLPKNGYEFSIDIPTTTKTAGNFSLILADLAGNSKEVLASRKIDLNDGYSRLFFPLNGMDGTIRANQIRYTFMDGGAVQESINLKNVQILSHEK